MPDYFYHPDFDDPGRAAAILADMPGLEAYQAKQKTLRPPRDVAPELAHLYRSPLLTRDQEYHLFRRMNYCLHQAATGPGDADRWRRRADDDRDFIVRANMRLVTYMVKRFAGAGEDLFELVSEGNLSLVRAATKFDFTRGFRFTTYAGATVAKNTGRFLSAEKAHRVRFPNGCDDTLACATRGEADEEVAEAHGGVADLVLELLEPRERAIARMRFGLGEGQNRMTLEEIGAVYRVSKERIRQVWEQAQRKIRAIVRNQRLEV